MQRQHRPGQAAANGKVSRIVCAFKTFYCPVWQTIGLDLWVFLTRILLPVCSKKAFKVESMKINRFQWFQELLRSSVVMIVHCK